PVVHRRGVDGGAGRGFPTVLGVAGARASAAATSIRRGTTGSPGRGMSRRTIAARALVGAALIGGLSLPATAPAAADGDGTSAPFAGTPVQGVDLKGAEQLPDDAPTLSPGVYRDKITSSEEGWRAYRVERTAPGSTLHVSLTTRPTSYGDPDD